MVAKCKNFRNAESPGYMKSLKRKFEFLQNLYFLISIISNKETWISLSFFCNLIIYVSIITTFFLCNIIICFHSIYLSISFPCSIMRQNIINIVLFILSNISLLQWQNSNILTSKTGFPLCWKTQFILIISLCIFLYFSLCR